MEREDPKITVVICSLGRPEVVRSLLPHLLNQSLPARRIVLSVPSPSDLPDDIDWSALPVPVQVVIAPKGSCAQRNAALDVVEDESDIVAFFDDDYVPSRYALEGIAGAFDAFPHVAGMTGRLLADGIHGRGITPEEATRRLHDWDKSQNGPVAKPRLIDHDLVGLYGCNMVIRADRIAGARFDERLPLYGWQEDIDFAHGLEGAKVKCDALVGIHCGVKSGRESNGGLLGYSQIANPYYLVRKGSMPPAFALKLSIRNILSNHVRALRPEPWIDRRGRMKGNWIALFDLLRGRSAPERILELSSPASKGR